jgi:iron complex outermembrane receptor protein
MVGMKFSIFGACAIAIAVVAAAAHADDTIGAPGSLRMRSHESAKESGKESGKESDRRVAQIPISDQATDDSDAEQAIPDPLSATPQVVQPPTVTVAPAPAAVTVTGSLIERATRVTPSPVTILTRDDLLASGRTMIGDVLQPRPEQGNAINSQFNNGGDGSTRIALRSLDASRTVVLLDGRRFVPVGTGADATVDLNTIPLATIERVEILNDTASAVYGSGAIGGVVNIITRSKFTGTEAALYTGQSERGDGFTFDASVITGHRSDGGRSHIVFSAGMQRQDPVFAGDRPFSNFDKDFDYTTGTEIRGGSTATPAGRINARGIDINGDGRPDPLNICGVNVTFCTPDGRGGFRPFIAPGDLYNFQPFNFLYTPSSRFNAYSAGTFRIAPELTGFFQMSFLRRESSQQLASDPFNSFVPISRNNIFNPFGGDVLSYSRRLEEFGPRRFAQGVDAFRVVTGMKGALPDDVLPVDHWK